MLSFEGKYFLKKTMKRILCLIFKGCLSLCHHTFNFFGRSLQSLSFPKSLQIAFSPATLVWGPRRCSQQVAEFMCSRQSVLCPGWPSPNCNPASWRVFDPLSTWAQKINLDDTLRTACALKTVDAALQIDGSLKISPEWKQQLHFVL